MLLPHAAQKDRGLIPGPGVSAHPGLVPGLNAPSLWADGRAAACDRFIANTSHLHHFHDQQAHTPPHRSHHPYRQHQLLGHRFQLCQLARPSGRAPAECDRRYGKRHG